MDTDQSRWSIGPGSEWFSTCLRFAARGVATSLFVGLAAWGLLALLERWRDRRQGWTIWTVVAVAFFVLSLAGPIGSARDAAIATMLLTLHTIVFATVVLGFRAARRV